MSRTSSEGWQVTIRFHGWGRAATGRALIALIVIGALATGGWLLTKPPQEAPRVSAAAPAAAGGGAATAAGPSVLQVSAPVQPREPEQQGPTALDTWATGLSAALDIPERALVGYATGELTLRDEQPGCQLSWVTLAGIGKASSDHGRFGGDALGTDGGVVEPLGAVPLRDAAAEAGGAGRSGPMQLSDQQWARSGSGSVQNIDDAAVATGRVLCAGGADLRSGQAWWQAVGDYRGSDLFRQQVLGYAQLYATLSLAPQLASTPSTRAARFALDQLGLPYVWGGNGPGAGAAGFDCSGLAKAAYDSAGVTLPRTADAQYRAEPAVPAGQRLRMGDLVFYGNVAYVHHVGLYLGNGLMINAPTEGMAVQITTYHLPGDDYTGAARPSN